MHLRLWTLAVAWPVVACAWLLGCDHDPPKPVAPSPPKRTAHPTAGPETIRAETPLTPARFVLITDFAPRFPLKGKTAYRLAAGATGFIDPSGSRAIAKLAGVTRIQEPTGLVEICVAENGKTTVAIAPDPASPRGPNQVLMADSFDGPMRKVGRYVDRLHLRGQPAWIANNGSRTELVECDSGRVDSLPALPSPLSSAKAPLWTDKVQVLQVETSPTASASPTRWDPSIRDSWHGTAARRTSYCLIRSERRSEWVRHADCLAVSRTDGSVAVRLPARRGRKGKRVCSFVLDQQGTRLACDAPVRPRNTEPTGYAAGCVLPGSLLGLRAARFYADSKVVAPSCKGALHRLGPEGSSSGRLGPTSLRLCSPLLPTRPMFHCIDDEKFDVVVRVGTDGRLHEELRRPRMLNQFGDPASAGQTARMFHVTWDGGVALGGDCDGNLGNVACVRTNKGEWRSVPFSPELVSALSRSAPATRLVPGLDGRLIVGTGTTDAIIGGRVQISIFHADRGPGVTVDDIPTWIVASLSGLNLGGLLGGAGANSEGPSLGWASDERVRVWPLGRLHPAFQTQEHCGIDIGLDGSLDTECTQGRLFAVGRLGIWERQSGKLFETLDAGKSWHPISIPAGLEELARDIQCTPLGCRIGPYWRFGWGGRGAAQRATDSTPAHRGRP